MAVHINAGMPMEVFPVRVTQASALLLIKGVVKVHRVKKAFHYLGLLTPHQCNLVCDDKML